ncbi:MAG: STAS domain-containing protein [Verrucomicrobia subdivision 3 bacterium]|nr:STAS domain-containing protein [Limisphaerales bacterium]
MTLKLSGAIDLRHSPKLRRLLRMKACARTPALLLDFTEVSRIDSSGLATLMEYYQHAQSFGGRLALAGLTGRVQSLFYLVRFSEIFPIHSSIDEALQALEQAPSEQNPL